MTETVETLKSLFENAECRLNTIMCEIEMRKCKKTGASVDPTELRTRLIAVQEKFAVAMRSYDNLKRKRDQYEAELSKKVKKIEDEINAA